MPSGGQVQLRIFKRELSTAVSRFACMGISVDKPALLALADGTIFRGISIGYEGTAVGEVVFNTAITGYQEILSDPSYAEQIVTLTYPHIGNTGTNANDDEAPRCLAAGLVVRDSAQCFSNWRATSSLGAYLDERGIPGIADIDTRSLTRLLRDRGAQSGCIATGKFAEPEAALARARNFPGLAGADLAARVTTETAYRWLEGSWDDRTDSHPKRENGRWRVVAFDFGVKRNILRLLADHDCEVEVVPARTTAEEVFALRPDGVFLSNGPGDPEPCDYAIRAISKIVDSGLPTFGICLGHQLLALACGARTSKMKFGHHGANHPVKDLSGGRVLITSQNHGFAVDADSLPATLVATHVSLFDGSLQGIRHTEKPAFGFQGHPEASPGPRDLKPLFEQFVAMMAGRS